MFFDVHFYELELAGPPTPPGVSEYGNEAGGEEEKSLEKFKGIYGLMVFESMDGHTGRRF